MKIRNFVIKDRKNRQGLPDVCSKNLLIHNSIATKCIVHAKSQQKIQKLKSLPLKKKMLRLDDDDVCRDKKELIDKSVGSNSPVFDICEDVPKAVKSFVNFQVKSASPMIHSSQSRILSNKSLPKIHLSVTSPFYSQKKDFRVLLVGQKIFSRLIFK